MKKEIESGNLIDIALKIAENRRRILEDLRAAVLKRDQNETSRLAALLTGVEDE